MLQNSLHAVIKRMVRLDQQTYRKYWRMLNIRCFFPNILAMLILPRNL